MTPNVSILLQRWGVADVIGDNLVQFPDLNMRRKDGTRIGYTYIPTVEENLGRPWWVVHRAHLHEGLATVAKRLGTEIYLDSRVVSLDWQGEGEVTVTTHKGNKHRFNLCVGADGLNSIVRRTLFPDAHPEPPTTNCAYRAIVPYGQVHQDPVARQAFKPGEKTMEVWMGENAYIITYPISAGKDLNLVLSHHRPRKVKVTEADVPIEEMRGQYSGFDERIRRVVEMIPSTVPLPPIVLD